MAELTISQQDMKDIGFVLSTFIVPTIIKVLQWIKVPMPKKYRWLIPFVGFPVSLILVYICNYAFERGFSLWAVIAHGIFSNIGAAQSYDSARQEVKSPTSKIEDVSDTSDTEDDI